MKAGMRTSRSLDYYGRERNVRMLRQIAGYFLLGHSRYGQCRIVTKMSRENGTNLIEMIFETLSGKRIASSGEMSISRSRFPSTVVRLDDIVWAFQDLLRNALPDDARLVLLNRASAGLHREYAKDCMIYRH